MGPFPMGAALSRGEPLFPVESPSSVPRQVSEWSPGVGFIGFARQVPGRR